MKTQNLEIVKGFDQSYILTFSDSDGVIDISQWTIFFTVKVQKTLAVAITKTVTVHTDPTNGISTIALTNQETNIARGTYKYTLTVQTGAAELYPVLAGTFIVTEI
jgi:hypothetical protein